MNNITSEEKQRIDKFSEMMDPYISKDFKQWLIDNGFFRAPASISHHGKYSGALFDHSFTVAKQLIAFTKHLGLTWSHQRSPYITGMFHDLCKMNNYVNINGIWKWNDAVFLPGHGEKSVMMLQQHMQLTDEELYCVRWHMGAFDSKENWDNYGKAVAAYPNVLYTHTADMVAARIIGI